MYYVQLGITNQDNSIYGQQLHMGKTLLIEVNAS